MGAHNSQLFPCWRRNRMTALVLWMWKLRFGEITYMPNATEPLTNRSQFTSAPLAFCFSLYYSMLPSNNIKSEISTGKGASSNRNSIGL